MTTSLRLTGQIEYQGRSQAIDLSIQGDILGLIALLSYPDDIAALGPALPAALPAPTSAAQITQAHISAAETDAEKWELLAKRFPDLFEDNSPTIAKPPGTHQAIEKLTQPDPLPTDLNTLRQLDPGLITKSNGQINLSSIARHLGYTTGGSKWDYIKELAAIMQTELDENHLRKVA